MSASVLSTHDPRRRLVSRLVLLGVVAAFVGPLLLATLWYAEVERWRPQGQVNHGQLVSPARPVTTLALRRLDGTPLGPAWLRGRWTLVQIGARDCDLRCQASLFKSRQARLSLGRDQERVQRLLVLPSGEAPQRWAPLLAGHPRLTVATAGPGQLAELRALFGAGAPEALMLVDPLGNFMMRYDAEATTKGILKDLKRLLKVSHIG